jgi:hypothetical protein
VWLEAGNTILMLERVGAGEPPTPKHSKELVCFAASRRKQAALRRHLRIEAETPHTIYFRDPDGRRLGLSCYKLATASKA